MPLLAASQGEALLCLTSWRQHTSTLLSRFELAPLKGDFSFSGLMSSFVLIPGICKSKEGGRQILGSPCTAPGVGELKPLTHRLWTVALLMALGYLARTACKNTPSKHVLALWTALTLHTPQTRQPLGTLPWAFCHG